VLDRFGELVVPGGRSSIAVADLNGDGRKDLLLGNTDGQLVFYQNAGTDVAPAFDQSQLLQADGTPIDLPGTPRSRPFVGDVNGDGTLDVLVGAADGLVRLYLGQQTGPPGSGGYVLAGEPGGTYVFTFEVVESTPAPITLPDDWQGVEVPEPVAMVILDKELWPLPRNLDAGKTLSGTDIARGCDAVLKEAGQRQSSDLEISFGKWIWLYDFDQMGLKSRTPKRENPFDNAVDRLLAACQV